MDCARKHAQDALRLATTPRQPLDLCDAHRFLGELDTVAGRHADAGEHRTTARSLADACAASYPRALALLATAELRAATGQRSEATRFRDEALAILEPLGATPAMERAGRIVAGDNGRPFGLSRREREVLDLVAQGMTDAEIAERLSISYRTVTTHLTAVFTKLNVNSRVAATRIAVEQGLVG
jgi:DNA-binding CsgD family transcriptional regulator